MPADLEAYYERTFVGRHDLSTNAALRGRRRAGGPAGDERDSGVLAVRSWGGSVPQARTSVREMGLEPTKGSRVVDRPRGHVGR